MISDIADEPVSKNSLKASAVNTKVTLVAYINVHAGF
jgi:hypothetical protein